MLERQVQSWFGSCIKDRDMHRARRQVELAVTPLESRSLLTITSHSAILRAYASIDRSSTPAYQQIISQPPSPLGTISYFKSDSVSVPNKPESAAYSLSGNSSFSTSSPRGDAGIISMAASINSTASVESQDNSSHAVMSVQGSVVQTTNINLRFDNAYSGTNLWPHLTVLDVSIVRPGSGSVPIYYSYKVPGTYQVSIPAGSSYTISSTINIDYKFSLFYGQDLGANIRSSSRVEWQVGEVAPPLPDIAMTSALIQDGFVNYTYRTIGDLGPVAIALYQSADQTFDATTDRFVTGRTIRPPGNATGNGSFSLSEVTPDPLRPYLLVIADPENRIPESSETNNVASVRWLAFDIAVVSADFHTSDSSISFVYTTTSNPGRFTVGVYLSHDLVFDSSDTLLGSQAVTPSPNATGSATIALGFSPAITPDRPYLLVVADPENFVTEPNETNNTAPVRYRIIDRQEFFNVYERASGEKLAQLQKDAIDTIINFIEIDRYVADARWMAYMLATAKHETATRFGPNHFVWLPNEEEGNGSPGSKQWIAYFDKYDRPATAKILGNIEKGDGYRFRGRGYVHLTGRGNYKRLGDVLGYDFVNHPELATDPTAAYNVMSYGMRTGLLTQNRNRSLEHFLNDTTTDYVGARRIINGTDQAGTIAAYALPFEAAFRSSLKFN